MALKRLLESGLYVFKGLADAERTSRAVDPDFAKILRRFVRAAAAEGLDVMFSCKACGKPPKLVELQGGADFSIQCECADRVGHRTLAPNKGLLSTKELDRETAALKAAKVTP